MHPHTLHALAAIDSLGDALTALRREAATEAAQIAAERLAAPACLRSPAWGRRHALGGHGDPTATTYLTGGVPFRVNRPQAVRADLTDQLALLALPLPGAGDPLARIRSAIPAATPRVLGPLAVALDTLDRSARRFLRQPRPTAPLMLAGGDQAECPGCRRRSLTVQQVGPREAWTVVCDGRWDGNVHNPCLCAGAGCGCGMSGAVEGVAHIWLRSDVLSTAGGAR